jgi:hypothetical protein
MPIPEPGVIVFLAPIHCLRRMDRVNRDKAKRPVRDPSRPLMRRLAWISGLGRLRSLRYGLSAFRTWVPGRLIGL